jgi:outer membrane autotransporter protein
VNDHAVVLDGIYGAVLTNTGKVTGFVTLAASDATGQAAFLNYGTWVARGGTSTVSAAAGSNLVNEGGGSILVVGNQTFVADTFTNFGLVSLQQGATGVAGRPAFEALTVSGDYTGLGGTLGVDVDTAANQGDVLKIKGTASGTTNVAVSFLGTAGGITGGGIEVAQTRHGASAGEFVLKGNTPSNLLVSGAFEYNLAFKAGSGTAGAWFLQSTPFTGVLDFGQVSSAAITVADDVNVDVTDLLDDANSMPVKSAELDQPTQVASMDNSFVPGPNGPGVSGWGRFAESRFQIDPSGAPGADYRLRVSTGQLGVDEDWHDADNTVVVGGYIAPFKAFADFNDASAHIDAHGTNYAVYGLWFSGPWSAGVRLNYAQVGEQFTDKTLGTDAHTSPNERGIQVAASYRMPFGETGGMLDDWTFEPQGEFNWGSTKSTQLIDGVGDVVKIGATDNVWGKLNGRFFTDVTTAHGLLVEPYVNIGLLYRGDSTTDVSIGTFHAATNINGFDGDFGFGVNTNLARNLSLSVQGDYLAGNRLAGWTGFISLRYTP